MTPEALTYDERGLIPAVVQEAETGEVLMVAWMDRAAVARTLESGLTHFWSRSRQAPWRKGETSGHSQHVQGVYADCDADTLLVQVHQDGVACHTGARTCFFTALQGGEEGNPARVPLPNNTGAAGNMLDRIERIVAERKAAPSAGSYVAGLLAKGEAAVCRKIGEEAVEVVTAALGGEGDRRVVEEVADLWFHTLVLLGERSIPLRDVLEELARRHAARPSSGG
ncbi:MAG TPA: bifunctional phosphoribosyl-AMP cyclohydrolase/phosphoribosyl-ATP diphosphatase HisIE [Candidatus Binatia bacterium]|nr:bifunctional phosphoribosyl-AMP cyclohydrolase/phosphoribosyl-ATP diphosphatase HisIE [Candidatus Binatia bacterium]